MYMLVLEFPVFSTNGGGFAILVVIPCPDGGPPPPDVVSDTDFELYTAIGN